jgi:hypothetical protein|tara:strand:- start:14695 stop:14955 length:261 start_codon:yes stop_codon:yes gene_type:complete
MRVEIDLNEEAIAMIVSAMRTAGLVATVEGRMLPYAVEELVEETGISTTGIRRLIEAGELRRIPNIGRVLVTAESLRRWQNGRAAK